MNYEQFMKHLTYVAEAHQKMAKPEAKIFRTLSNGEKNPYFTHSLWCATMILLEAHLPETIRYPGAEALLFHDVLEDTNCPLPNDLSTDVKSLIKAMTYKGGFDEEKVAVLQKPPIIQLLKLYDKTATLYDGDLRPIRYKEWIKFMQRLIITTKKEFGTLNIVLMANELIKRYRQKPVLQNRHD